MTMLLVGVVLGIVGRGYQAMSRLNLASYQMSQRMELSAFLQRLSYELVSATDISITSTGFRYQRINPVYNLSYNEPAPARLPWPNPLPPPTVDLMNASYKVSVEYRYVAAENKVDRIAGPQTSTQAVNIGEFLPVLEPGGKTLLLTSRPKEMTAPLKVRILMPVVGP